MSSDLRLTFYGDDFTGSTDVMESLCLNGVRTVLFLDPPSPERLAEFPDAQAVGVCGRSRSMSPAEMDDHLPGVFEALAELDAPLCQYKICSTLDSSPEVGSIGHAIDLGRDAFPSDAFVPFVVGAPPLSPRGRYVAFGHLFAAVDGEVYRLDRHPTMKNHPVTPMNESDVRKHVAKQTDASMALVDVRDLRGEAAAVDEAIADASGADVVVFDTVDGDDLRTVGRVVWEAATETEGTSFAVGSSGLDYALANDWAATGDVTGESTLEHPGPVDRIVVVSGSASPETAAQIEWALDHEFEGVRLDTAALVDPDERDDERERAVRRGRDIYAEGQSPVLYAARGPEDDAIERTNERVSELGLADGEAGRRLGTQQGRILAEILRGVDATRVCVAGGDTSGYATPELDVYALEALVPTEPGCPICTAYASEDRFDGIEIALKGGQVGNPDYFRLVREGGKLPDA
ncbi:MAG: four-carbon acid sugar kinase family protein [Haloplanus sp.]